MNRVANIFMKYKIYFIVLIGFIGASVFVPAFFTTTNISNVLDQMATNGTVALGMTIVIISWGVDLSAGSILMMTGIIYAVASPLGTIPAILISILSGSFVGLWNGLLINLFKVNFFVATLSSWTLFQGVGLTICGGNTVYGVSKGFEVVGNGGINIGSFTLGFSFLIFILIAVLLHILLKYTRLGRNIYARGGNPETAHLAGINVKFTYTMAYVIMGTCAGVAGMMLASRMSSASPMVGLETNLIAIASAVLGGSSLFGGKGGIIGTVAGVFFLSILENVMSLLAVDAYYQYIIRGCVLVAVVLIDVFYEGKKKKTASILKVEEDTMPDSTVI